MRFSHYFPYGLRRNNEDFTTLKNNYQYNGIDHVGDFGLDWDMATYRSLMSDIARWGQVDPKAEAVASLSPYQSMGNNPISHTDPEGDLFWVMPHISFDGGFSLGITAGIGAFSATASYGKGGFAASAGVGVRPLSLSYGTGGFNAGLGYGVNEGGLGLHFGGVSYSSQGLSFSGPSASYGHRFDFERVNFLFM